MKPKNRVLTALNQKSPDKCPINFRATEEIIEKLKKHLDTDYEGLLEYFNVDFREVIPDYAGPKPEELEDGSKKDIWGVGWQIKVTSHSRDKFVSYSPLEEADEIEDIIEHDWPSADLFDFSNISSECEKYSEYAVSTPGIHISGYHGVFHRLTYLFGMEKALINLVSKRDLMKKAIDKIMVFLLDYYEKLFESAEGKIDFLFYKDDFGSQDNLLISRDMFLEFFAPTLEKLVKLAQKYDVKFILHSCGSVYDIIPDFIDLGIEVLDPIQTSAADMDIDRLAENYGDKITFHGGIDTQSALPDFNPDEIKELVNKTIETLGDGGGYFFSPSHRIQQDTPLENIIAMYEAADEFYY